MGKIIFTILNAVIFAASLGVVFHLQTDREFARDVIKIAPLVNESRFFFDAASVEVLEISFPDFTIATSGQSNAHISSTTREMSATVFHTNAVYFQLRTMNFTEGRRTGNAAIINETLAWGLFGTTENVTGLPVNINGEMYIVSGVVRQNSPNHTVWLPHCNTPISSLYLRPNTHNPLAEYQAQVMLTNFLNRNPEDFTIIPAEQSAQNRVEIYALIAGLVSYVNLLFFLRYE
jgi:hypothetical protein